MEHLEVESPVGSQNGTFHSFSGNVLNSERQAIASVMGIKYVNRQAGWVPYEQASYNASLIASAPDLLDALQECMAHIAVFLGGHDVPESAKKAVEKALNIQR